MHEAAETYSRLFPTAEEKAKAFDRIAREFLFSKLWNNVQGRF